MNKCNCQNTIIHKDIVDEVSKKIENDNTIKHMADFFSIFGDKNRLKIINILMNSNKMCVCDIASLLNMSQSSISHQLIVLKKFKIVKFEKKGKVVYYELDDNHINKIFKEGREHINE